MMLTIFITVIMLVVISMLWNEGLWSNALTMVNAFLASIVATNLYEPLAGFMDKQADSLTYFWDFLSLWLIFAISFGVFRSLTDQLSKTRVRFKMPVDLAGRAIFGLGTAWYVAMFTLFSLHTAPTDRSSFGKGFAASPDAANFFFSPDIQWLGFMQSRSEEGGAMARSTAVPFDPKSEFILKYGQRRREFGKMPTLAVQTGRRRGR